MNQLNLSLRICLTGFLYCFASVYGLAQKKYLNTYPDDIPGGSLRLVEVTGFYARTTVVNEKKAYEALLKLGVQDEEIIDGRFAKGKIYCCGGTAEGPTQQLFYVPTEMIGQIQTGDIVEIQTGRKPTGQTREEINIMTRVVQSSTATENTCRWVPENPKLWMRCLYCDWMEKDGWIELDKKLDHTWYKPDAIK
jgi:hypothetical protein